MTKKKSTKIEVVDKSPRSSKVNVNVIPHEPDEQDLLELMLNLGEEVAISAFSSARTIFKLQKKQAKVEAKLQKKMDEAGIEYGGN